MKYYSCFATLPKRCFVFIEQLLQEEARKGEELWASADESCKGLARVVHRGTAQRLEEQVERERKRLDMQPKKKKKKAKTLQSLFYITRPEILKAHFVTFSDASHLVVKKCIAHNVNRRCWILHLVYIICDVKHAFIHF